MEERKEFDLRTHIIDGKTGTVVKHQPYRIVGEGHSQFFVREGKRYTPGGEFIREEELPDFKPTKPPVMPNIKRL